ncbi:lytic transglycosylase domain-containing protein [Chelativorans sp. YIM 93263]|uniref:lytic transglycosylase domain-containing protein n=1 Tax=Chelativorans sp. YIM 93263 TaxID=2906648 RepID=UPI002379CFFE|nr:lytic transglycosylase domain-containing protein [Chelativorans sp. YIM 93263]
MTGRTDFRDAAGFLFLLLAFLFAGGFSSDARAQSSEQSEIVGTVCTLIESHAKKNGLPADFFARLIWTESRFNPNAVSPKGAEGIAQFMPTTAAMRGLKDAFDIEQAIPASAVYLGELTRAFGNLGLAAAAYNAGEARVERWLANGGFLPLETENYVLQILGEPAERFSEQSYSGTVQPLSPDEPFGKACRELPVSRTSLTVASVPIKPWGVQIAGHFRRDVAMRQWERARREHASLLDGHKPAITRVRSHRGKNGIHAVRIGADNRAEADQICSRLRSAGGSCVVVRNR